MAVGNGVDRKRVSAVGVEKKLPAPPSLTLLKETKRKEAGGASVAGRLSSRREGLRTRSRTPTGLAGGSAEASTPQSARGVPAGIKRSATPQSHTRRLSSVTPTGHSRLNLSGKAGGSSSGSGKASTPRSSSPAGGVGLRATSSSPLFLRRNASTPTSPAVGGGGGGGGGGGDDAAAMRTLNREHQQLKQQLAKVTQERDSLKAALRVHLDINKGQPASSRMRSPSAGRARGGGGGAAAEDGIVPGFDSALISNFGIGWSDIVVDYEALLGTGGYGKVYKGDYQGTEVAVKVLRADRDFTDSELKVWRTEVQIMTQLRHPNTLTMLGAVFERSHLAIITEYCESGTLQEMFRDLMEAKQELLWARKLKWLADISRGMAYLHHRHIFHRDLKSANVFVQNDTMQIADFGLSQLGTSHPDRSSNGNSNPSKAKPFSVAKKGKDRKNKSLIEGTFAFMSPEVWAGQPYTTSCDVYSFGVLITELLAGDVPFERDLDDDCSWRIMTYATRPKVIQHVAGKPVPKGVQEIQAMCLAKPHRRPAFTTLVTALRNELKEPYAKEVAEFPTELFDSWVGIPWSEWPQDVHDPLSETVAEGQQSARGRSSDPPS
eukprot:Rhum_TRINITY_DN14249_c12_g1::Rhum_TRINITY_DN14249_c12_g1_i1::g.76940::m.76940